MVKDYRRERVELEDAMDPTSKQNMSVLDRHFDEKLDRLSTEFKEIKHHNDVAPSRLAPPSLLRSNIEVAV